MCHLGNRTIVWGAAYMYKKCELMPTRRATISVSFRTPVVLVYLSPVILAKIHFIAGIDWWFLQWGLIFHIVVAEDVWFPLLSRYKSHQIQFC